MKRHPFGRLDAYFQLLGLGRLGERDVHRRERLVWLALGDLETQHIWAIFSLFGHDEDAPACSKGVDRHRIEPLAAHCDDVRPGSI